MALALRQLNPIHKRRGHKVVVFFLTLHGKNCPLETVCPSSKKLYCVFSYKIHKSSLVGRSNTEACDEVARQLLSPSNTKRFWWWWWLVFVVWLTDKRQNSLISSQDHCQRSSPPSYIILNSVGSIFLSAWCVWT